MGLRVKKAYTPARRIARKEFGGLDVGFGSAQFRLTTNGVINLSNMNTQTTAALNRQLAQTYPNLFESGYRDIVKKGLDHGALLSTALTAARPITTVFPNTGFSLFRKAHTTPMNRS